MKFDLDRFGTPNVFKWNHDHLVSVLTTGHNRVAKDTRLIKAIKLIRRGDFIPEEYLDEAYYDKEIEIGYKQHSIRPSLIAYMIELLNPKSGGRVLDIGCGTGYSTALLAIVVGSEGKIFGVDREQYLVNFARTALAKYPEIKNTEVFFRDGYLGLVERSPYDAIIAGGVYDEIPNELKNQLNIGGKLLLPFENYKFKLITRKSMKEWDEEEFDGVILNKIEKGIA